MTEDKARDIYKAHEWYDESLQEMALDVVENFPFGLARIATIRGLIARDHESELSDLEAERAFWKEEADQAAARVADAYHLAVEAAKQRHPSRRGL